MRTLLISLLFFAFMNPSLASSDQSSELTENNEDHLIDFDLFDDEQQDDDIDGGCYACIYQATCSKFCPQFASGCMYVTEDESEYGIAYWIILGCK